MSNSPVLPLGLRQSVALHRAFLSEFFTTELATTDIQLRQVMIWVLAFLITPGLFVLIHVGFIWDHVVTLPPPVAADLLVQLGVLFVTLSVVSTGLVAVLVWDALSFSGRDAMVLGSLPLSGTTIVAAKLAALATFVIGTAAAINLPSAALFAVMTGSDYGVSGVLRHLVAHLTSTVGAAAFIFGAVATVRGTIALTSGLRLATWAGSALQFTFVAILLWFLISIPSTMTGGTPWMFEARAVAWLPTSWFLAVFERLLGLSSSPPVPAARAFVGLGVALCSGAFVIGVGFRRQMRFALAPRVASPQGPLSHLSLLAARVLAGRHEFSRAISDFILVTLWRNRAQQAPIVFNAAIGLAIVVAALSTTGNGLDALRHPRVVVLWVPLVFAYWICVGMRAAFFMPAEPAAAWVFRVATTDAVAVYSSAIRAAMLTYVLPRVLLLTVPVGVFLGWRLAAQHALFVGVMTVLLVQIIGRMVAFVPFTRSYRPGHANLRSWWAAYAVGLYLFAYIPTRAELEVLEDPVFFSTLLASIVLVSLVASFLGDRLHGRLSAALGRADDPDQAISLGITAIAPRGSDSITSGRG